MDYKFDFEDLSYSGIVNIIDKDKNTAKEYLFENYNKIIEQKKVVEELKTKLYNEQTYLRSLEDSIEYVFKHMSFEKPLTLINSEKNNEIIVFSNSDITLVKNVL